MDQFSRTTMLFGKDKMESLFSARVAIFGIGGVGGYCAEALARSGIGAIDIFDDDSICITNINRQIIATRKTVGQNKVDVMRNRILDINPDAKVGAHKLFYSPQIADCLDLSVYDYIVDAVDTITAKLELVCRAYALSVPIISCMGAANKIDASAFEITDIFSTSVCPVARIMRQELRKRKIPALKVVYSKEAPMKPIEYETTYCRNDTVCQPNNSEKESVHRKQPPASNAFVPPVAGFIMAGAVIGDLIRS